MSENNECPEFLSASYADTTNIEANKMVVSDTHRLLLVVQELPDDVSGYPDGTLFIVNP